MGTQLVVHVQTRAGGPCSKPSINPMRPMLKTIEKSDVPGREGGHLLGQSFRLARHYDIIGPLLFLDFYREREREREGEGERERRMRGEWRGRERERERESMIE